MSTLIQHWFLEHPAAVGETYWQHWGQAVLVAGHMAVGAAAALLHAFIPGLCQTTASGIARRVCANVDGRTNNAHRGNDARYADRSPHTRQPAQTKRPQL